MSSDAQKRGANAHRTTVELFTEQTHTSGGEEGKKKKNYVLVSTCFSSEHQRESRRGEVAKSSVIFPGDDRIIFFKELWRGGVKKRKPAE